MANEFRSRRRMERLEQLCLSSIASNFEWHIAYLNSPDSCPNKKHYGALFLLYSETLFNKLKKDWKLPPEYLDYLINEDVKNLDIVGMNPTWMPRLVEMLEIYGSNIISFKATFREVQLNGFEIMVTYMPNVRCMDLTVTSKERSHFFWRDSTHILVVNILPLFETTCQLIGNHCHLLEVLNLRISELFYPQENDSFNDNIAFVLRNCPLIKTLEFFDTIGALYRMHKQDLDYIRSKNSDWSLCKKYDLRNISSAFPEYPLCDALELCVFSCPNVSDIYIGHLTSYRELEQIERFVHLEHLKLVTVSGITADCLNEFFKLRGAKLISLKMPFEYYLSVINLHKYCPKLESLKLHTYIDFFPKVKISCKKLISKLRVLEFKMFNFKMENIANALKEILTSTTSIRELSLVTSSGITDQLLKSLDFSNIHQLDLSYSDVSVYAVKELLLRRNSNLKKLIIIKCVYITSDNYINLHNSIFNNQCEIVVDEQPKINLYM